ncbi:MAG TPA: CmcI family methyltransferase, partial [Phycisphaerales bacterium]|nr:CmcI family methyltransferase [Phycisphaerales bacterium]
VISIDVKPRGELPKHEGVTWITGDATSPEVLTQVRNATKNRKGMVIEDSDHKEHVTEKLLEQYADFVAPGCYFIVEDTLCEFTQTPPFPGPLGAVKRFVARHPDFQIDRSREKYVLTYNPMGYLLKS